MVRIRTLPNKPLVEAILELRWHVDPDRGDPNYSIFVGRLYNLLRSKYPYHEPLPTSMIPEQIAGNIVQHRFRINEHQWPLIQVGPGIVTLNDTESYTWDDFGTRARDLVKSTFKAYPDSNSLKVTSLLLRYIDSDDLDYLSENVFAYLRDKLKVRVTMPRQLFKSVSVKDIPKGMNFLVAYQTGKPKGTITLRFATGTRAEKRSLVWETAVQSINEELPPLPKGFASWARAAHTITDDWFFKLIEGELERRYAGES